MKVNELSKQLCVTNKDLIDFLKSKNHKVSSHMQNVTDEMIDQASEYFSKREDLETASESSLSLDIDIIPKEDVVKPTKIFTPDDLIPCRSVTPWKLNAIGVDRKTVYHWNNFGDTDYVTYRDLQALRRKDIITKPKIIIEDPDLCYQWRREIGETYRPFLGVEYPEELFDLSNDEFEKLLKTSSDTVREIVKVTALNMIRNQNYPSINKLILVDSILGTCIREFL